MTGAPRQGGSESRGELSPSLCSWPSGAVPEGQGPERVGATQPAGQRPGGQRPRDGAVFCP